MYEYEMLYMYKVQKEVLVQSQCRYAKDQYI